MTSFLLRKNHLFIKSISPKLAVLKIQKVLRFYIRKIQKECSKRRLTTYLFLYSNK